MPTDLWPTFATPVNTNAPVHVLKEQAGALQSKTNSVVLAEVQSFQVAPDKFGYKLSLYSPNLPGYSFRLLHIVYPLEFYPMMMEAFGVEYRASDEGEFRKHLATVFNDPKTKQTVEAIMAQVVAVNA